MVQAPVGCQWSSQSGPSAVWALWPTVLCFDWSRRKGQLVCEQTKKCGTERENLEREVGLMTFQAGISISFSQWIWASSSPEEPRSPPHSAGGGGWGKDNGAEH